MDKLPKVYNPQEVEEKIYKKWEESKYFTPKIRFRKAPFVIMMPPPNVTGNLHIGHALNLTIQDILIRWHRMRGDITLWLPGTDHAGIATQNVVERKLKKEGKNRFDLGRKKFVNEVWRWVSEYGRNIKSQIRRLGCSCDWTRERFTLDDQLSQAVRKAFVTLYNRGLIYKGEYIINWCPHCQSVIADDEVEYQEEESRLWYIKYPIKDQKLKAQSQNFIVIATTRPETMLADTAVAVNPKDRRYKKLIGKTAILPLVGREIPIIADSLVNIKFGTGALKVTPGHDKTDYEIGQKHRLPIISVIGFDGQMTSEAGPFEGLTIKEAREAVVGQLKKQGYLKKEEGYKHSIGQCYRCKTTIEPLISLQWFVKMKPLAKRALKMIKAHKPKFVPKRFEKIYRDWLEDIRDWCISRQLWWGHQIPVWYCDDCEFLNVQVNEPKRCKNCGSKNLTQDPDVLDTWFSSALWPFSTLGWPKETKDFLYFYPTSVLVTGYDIIFFWVSRMTTMSFELTGENPFEVVFIHGMVRDEKGKKMSKSIGNVIDPLKMIEKYSADALRMSLIANSKLGGDVNISDGKIKGYRNFANKIWNAARFIMINLQASNLKIKNPKLNKTNLVKENKKIIEKLNQVIKTINQSLENYRFSDAALTLYDFFWHEFCDHYIEESKKYLKGSDKKAQKQTLEVLIYVLETSLKLLHPFMPFITEHIWQKLGHQNFLMQEGWPY